MASGVSIITGYLKVIILNVDHFLKINKIDNFTVLFYSILFLLLKKFLIIKLIFQNNIYYRGITAFNILIFSQLF